MTYYIIISRKQIHSGGKSPKKSYFLSLNITEKVSFNIASEASYIYIFSGQKFIKIFKNLATFWKHKICG